MTAPIILRYGLPFVSVVIDANDQQLRLENVLLDTGAAATVFRTDDLLAIGVMPAPTDHVRFMAGIGGREAVIEKQIDKLVVGNLLVAPFTIQLGAMDYGFEINGIVGMDFLLATRATIDLSKLVVG